MAHFFEVPTEFVQDLFGGQDLTHKKCGQSGAIEFDALGCDGAGNYLKCNGGNEMGWKVQEFAARSYGKEAKNRLQDLLVQIYSTDSMTELLPVTQETELLSLFKSRQIVAQPLTKDPIASAALPLGWAYKKTLHYKIIKMSAFVFQSPQQREKVLKQYQAFVDRNGCGLEVLAFRRTYGNRRRGSIQDWAKDIFDMIVRGRDHLNDRLNLRFISEDLATRADQRSAELAVQKQAANHELLTAIQIGANEKLPTGLVLQQANLEFIGS